MQLPDYALRVLKLEKLIELKEQLGGEKDKAVLPLLRATLRERNKRQRGFSKTRK